MTYMPARVHLRDDFSLTPDGGSVSGHVRPQIVGGHHISISQAPWQVFVLALLSKTEALLCGGSVLDSSEVLTAGHCVFYPGTGIKIPAGQIGVFAGTADVEVKEPGQQLSLASNVLPHPYYNPAAPLPSPDDVAILQLAEPFTLNGDVEAISPISAGTVLNEGASVNLTGFGEEDPFIGELSGELNSISMTLDYSRECSGELDALFLCASSPSGSVCFGDSGSGLTLPGSPAVLAGVADTVQIIDGEPCLDGALGGFVSLAAPEVRDFVVEHSSSPPQAPRGGSEVVIRGVIRVGQALTCEPGFWSNGPTFTYLFINSANGQALQQGSSSTYLLTPADVGRTIFCQVLAANAGGTGLSRTAALAAIKPSALEEERRLGEEEWVKKDAEEGASQGLEKARAERKHEEETAAAAKKRQEEEAAKHGTQAYHAVSPDAIISSTSLSVSRSGALVVKIKCPAGETNCAGKITLRTAHAVIADTAAREARQKATVLTLASGSFSVPGGETKTVTLHLSPTARKLLARLHVLSARTTIVAHDSAGSSHTGQTLVTLHAGGAGHHKG